MQELYHYLTHQLRKRLQHLKLGGVREISKASVVAPNDKLSRTPQEERIVTAGSCIRSVWALPGIEWHTIMSNNITEVVRTLGIEAGTQVLFHELRLVMESGGSSVADRHLMLLAASMTRTGELLALTRHAQGKKRRSPLTMAAFEQQITAVLDGATFASHEPVRTLTETVITGRRPQIGTGIVTLVMDPAYEAAARAAARQRLALLERVREKGGTYFHSWWSL